jgi:CTP:molybdopterin cytidylyltransferase MocA
MSDASSRFDDAGARPRRDRESGIFAILLAAGRGTRFGGDKLLASLGGRPVIGHAIDALRRAREAGNIDGGVVIYPAGDAPLRALLEPSGLELVPNDDPDAGLSRSIRLGLAALAARTPVPGAAILFLADQPSVRAETIAALVAAWREGRGQVIRPRYAEHLDEPGHPVLLDRELWPLAEALEGDTGLGPLLRRDVARVTTVDLPGANPDIDTPDDLLPFTTAP